MDNGEFVIDMIARGVLRQLHHPFHDYLAIDGRSLLLKQDEHNRDFWGIYTDTYLIGVKAIVGKRLADVWPTLDFDALESCGRESNDRFRNTQDC